MRIWIFCLWALTAIFTGVIASDKGHDFASWTVAGFMIGPLGLIAAAGLSDQKLREYIRRSNINRLNIESQIKLLENSHHNAQMSPKLLEQSTGIPDNQIEQVPKEKFIGEFLLNKDSGEDQIWEKILEVINYRKPDIAYLADRSTSDANLSLQGGKGFLICDKEGVKLALAYVKDNTNDDQLHWQVRIY